MRTESFIGRVLWSRPFCTQYLSTFGADVIKIENSTQGGDFARTTGPNSLGLEDSLYFQSFINLKF